MTPRSPLATSAYAFNSDTVDGLDSTAFAASSGSANYIQNGTSPQTASFNVTGTGTVGGNMTVNGASLLKVTSATALQIQDASSNTLLTVSTTSSHVVIGTLTDGVVLSASGISYLGTARPVIAITLAPEYPGATFTADGTNNNGSLSSDFCSGTSRLSVNTANCAATDTHNYYQWTTTEATAQDYDVFVRYQMPTDYDTGSMTNLTIWGWGTTSAAEVVSVALYSPTSGATACNGTPTNAVASNATWAQATTASPLGACTIVAGDTVTFKVRVAAGTNNFARAGEISFNYRGKQ